MTLAVQLKSAARRIVAVLPEPLANRLRAAKTTMLNRRSAGEVFTRIADRNEWDGTESISGPGSTLAATQAVRDTLPGILRDIGAKSVLDIPCGDAHWIASAIPDGVSYTGGDIVPDVVDRARAANPGLGEFRVIDLIADALPPADLILVRDCFIHLPNAVILKTLDNIRAAGIGHILTTTYPGHATNAAIELGGFRPVDMTRAPFNFPPPIQLIAESGEAASGKSLGLWRMAEV